MLLPVFFRGYSIFFFESTEKAGVIFKAILWKNAADRFAGEDSLPAGMEPFLQYILMQRNTHIIFENVSNMVFTYIKIGSDLFQAQVIFQIQADIVADL